MRMPHLFCALILAALAWSTLGARAVEIPVNTTEIAIARGASQSVKIPALPKDKPVYLTLVSRVDATAMMGSNFMMRLAIGGKTIEAFKTPDAPRMKNRAANSPISPTLSGAWFGAPSGWRVLYAPDFVKAQGAKYYEGNPHTIVLDVSDLIAPGTENNLEITNTVSEKVAAATGKDGVLIVQKISVSDEIPAPSTPAPTTPAPAPTTPVATTPAPTTPAPSTPVATGDANSPEGISVVREPLVIARGASKALEFGNVPQGENTVLLEITSRLDSKLLSGSSFFLKMMLNGQEVQGAKTRTAVRLKNRAMDSPVTPTISAPWYGANGGWRVLYAPDFEGGRKAKYYEGDPYTLILDVTDLINPAAENRLEIINTALERSAQAAQTNADLIVQKLSIRVVPGKSPMMASASSLKPFINRGERAGGAAKYAAQVLPGGGFIVTVGNRQWKFNSAFSFPNAGLNHFVAALQIDKTGQAAWKVQTKTSPQGGEVTASGAEYRVRRALRFTPRKIEVSDAITNTTNAPLGLLVRHEVSLEGLSTPGVRLAGNPDQTVSEYFSPGNPSVHVLADNHAIGLLCEDDIFRNQARLFVRETTASSPAGSTPGASAGLRTEMLMLAPNETYTLRWSAYPIASLDYYDFVNLVREDWNANHTALGAWWWGFVPDTVLAMPLEELRGKLERQGIRYATIGGGWLDPTDPARNPRRIGFGTGVMDSYWADYRRRVREAGEKLRLASPGLKVLAYYDTQRDTSEGGRERFKDSYLTGPDGQQISTEWSGQFSLTQSNVATLKNSYGKEMLRVADAYMDEMKLDGIYWDEMENVSFGSPLLTYNIPDGHSCLLDLKTYTIKTPVGLTTLLGEGHRLEVIRRVQAKGGVLLGNGPTTTRDILDTKIQRMVESQHNDHWNYEGNFQTPLGYISSYTKWENYVRLIRLASLPVAIGLDMPHDISRHLFPFTPIELHEGYLYGRERIVTIHDGNFGWDGNFKYRLWIYDGTGKVRDENPVWQSASGRVKVEVPEGGIVVMEREIGK